MYSNQEVDTCLQPLYMDRDEKFQYKYMGYAEYEFGAIAAARFLMAMITKKNTVKAKSISLQSVTDKKPIKFIIYSEKSFIDAQCIKLQKGLIRNKGLSYFDDEKILAWLHVQPNPGDIIPNPENIFMLFRPNKMELIIPKLELFFQDILEISN